MDDIKTIVEAQMLIRKPAAEVFAAFIDPEHTKNFWFTKASSNLEKGKTVTWHWEMYNVSAEVLVTEIIKNELIVIEWGERATTVEFKFKAIGDTTYVEIRNYGFTQTGSALLAAVTDATGGFTTVLDGLKAYMEHNINLNLIGDKFPRSESDHGVSHS